MTSTMKNRIGVAFLFLALAALLTGAFFGLLSITQYLLPDFFKEALPFNQMRELHVTLVVSWIILAATGGIYHYVENEVSLFSKKLQRLHFRLFAFTGLLILLSLFTKQMGGREYMTFSPYLYFPIIIGWILFAYNFFKSVLQKIQAWPVYIWMWATGILFMIFTYTEAHLWVFSFFGEHVVKDLTVQWKSYGAMVGSWNMLVYGTAIYLMSKIKKDESVARGKLPFFFYFLGLTNLMFAWAHHTYIVPASPWIRTTAYVVSMSEWIILGYMIWNWRKTLKPSIKQENTAYRWLFAADIWVFLNLILALLMSIPAINFFTHGTHVTVAHSMGTTIGINTSILMASLSYIFLQRANSGWKRGFMLFHASLLLFLVALVYAGYQRSLWMYGEGNSSFGALSQQMHPTFMVAAVAGFGLLIALFLVAFPLLKKMTASLK